ncbi:DnaJ domain-containing protein [Peptacetobacter sp. AB845]|uniref:DnaJ domain-containing protein n=1 Tax=Peptacetobacter sp. AB845 TaxID=3388429 RepID=UPI0039C8D613
MENYYEILEIRKNATNGEIKNSYIKLLRVYPPEKNQEKFSKIREAYEVLSNEKTKKEYDIFLEYGDDIKKLEEKADEAFEKEDFKKAIINLKKYYYSIEI